MNEVKTVLELAAALAPELIELARYAAGDTRDEATDQRLALAIIRKAFDERARREIGA
jgi:hypothetical protein